MDFILEGLIEAFWLLVHLDGETLSAVKITLQTSTLSIAVAILIGLPVGFALGHFDFPFRKSLRLLSDTLLAIPTVVVGLIVYALISSRGPLGEYGLLYTSSGIIIGQTILALPIIISLTAATIEGVNQKLYLTLLSFYPTKLRLIIDLAWEMRHALIAVIVTAYGRIVAEVGIAMMIGGNIKWHTRTITTAISLETSKGEFAMGIALGIVLISLSFYVNLMLYFLKKRAGD